MAKTRRVSKKGTRKGKTPKALSKWTNLVKSTYATLKKKNPNASLGDAMKAAKKVYKKE